MKIHILPILCSFAVLASCSSPEHDAHKIQAFHAQGMATIEDADRKSKPILGQKVIFFVWKIDNARRHIGIGGNVTSVSPGRRSVVACARIVDPKLGGYNTREAYVPLAFTALPRGRYKIAGHTDGSSVTMWIVDVSRNRVVSNRASASLRMQKTRMIPMPLGL